MGKIKIKLLNMALVYEGVEYKIGDTLEVTEEYLVTLDRVSTLKYEKVVANKPIVEKEK